MRILIPYFTMHKLFPSAREHMLVVIAKEGKLAEAEDELRAVLRIERRVPYNKPDTFWITGPSAKDKEISRLARSGDPGIERTSSNARAASKAGLGKTLTSNNRT